MRPSANRSRGGARWLDTRVGLFWLGALVWLTGLLLGLPVLTIVAMVILFAALLLGLVARKSAPDDTEPADEEGRRP